MAQGDVNIIINADASKMESEVKRARAEMDRLSRAMENNNDTTGALNEAHAKAQRAFMAAADAARKAGVDLSRYEQQVDLVADSTEAAQHTTQRLGTEIEHLDKGTRILNGALGDVIGPMNDFTELADKAGPSTAAVAVAGLAVVAALSAVASQVVGVITNIEDYTEAIDRAAHTNMVTQAQVDQLYEASAGVTLSQRVWDTFIATAATRFAPTWNKFMTGLIGSVTYFGELADQVFKGNILGAHSAALEVAAGTVQGYLRQRKELADQIQAEAHTVDKSTATHAAAKPKLVDLARTHRQVADSIRQTAASTEAATVNMEAFAESASAAAKGAADDFESFKLSVDPETISAEVDFESFTIGDPEKIADGMSVGLEAAIKNLRERAPEIKAEAAKIGDSMMPFANGASALADVFAGALELADGASRQVRMRLFTMMKAARVSEAVINGAVAITRAFAELGPIGGAIMAPIVAAQTGVQLGLIARERPSFHRGGYLASPSMLAPDEVVIRRNEVPAMMTAQGARALGQSGLARMNAGEAPATGGGVFVMLDGRRVGTRLFAAPDPTYGMRLAGVY